MTNAERQSVNILQVQISVILDSVIDSNWFMSVNDTNVWKLLTVRWPQPQLSCVAIYLSDSRA